MLKAIWAQSLDGVIGDGRDMPWHLPEDLRHFKDVTMGEPVTMGRATWESIPKRFRPLPGRQNLIVSSREAGEWSTGATVVSVEEARGWVIGGGQLYAALLPRCLEVEITLIDVHLTGVFSSAVFAPSLPDSFEQVDASPWMVSEKGHLLGSKDPLRYRFLRYRRKEA